MKYRAPRAEILAAATGLMGLGAWAGTAQPLPTPFPEMRYERMSSKSPFAVASATSLAKGAPTPGFASQLYVDGVAHVGRTDFVAIKSREPDTPTIFLEVGQSAKDGMKVERVQWSDRMGKSTVEVSKGGEKATLLFDEQVLAKAANPAMGSAPVDFTPPRRNPTVAEPHDPRTYRVH